MSEFEQGTIREAERRLLPMEVTPEAREYLRETAKWGKFLAIVYFVLCGFMLLAALGMLIGGGKMGAMMGGRGMGPMMIGSGYFLISGFVYAVVGVVYIFLALYQYRFATGTLKALDAGDSAVLTGALGQLRKLYRLMGILMIVALGLIALALIVMLMGGFARMMY